MKRKPIKAQRRGKKGESHLQCRNNARRKFAAERMLGVAGKEEELVRA